MIQSKKHIQIHKDLHKNLDRLVADFILHTEKLPSKSTILELILWSVKQQEKPDLDMKERHKFQIFKELAKEFVKDAEDLSSLIHILRSNK